MVPGTHVWRIVNFELEAVEPAHHGAFFSGDSYVILRTTTERANALFVWQGEGSSTDERGASAIQSVRVAEAVAAAGGAHCSQRREEQGAESAAFLALFKGDGSATGLIYMQGGAKSGFHHVAGAADAVHEPALLHVRGRRSVVARQVAVAASSLSADGCFILDTYSTLFLWHGVRASSIEKANAVAVMARLHGARGGHCERVLVASAEAAQAATFWSALGGSEADVQPASADGGGGEGGGGGAAAAAQAEAPLELFALAKGGAAPIRVAKGRLTRAALLAAVSATQRHTMLVDAGSEALVWVARTAPSDERHGALALADAFIAAHRPPAPLPPGWTAQKDEEGDTCEQRPPSQMRSFAALAPNPNLCCPQPFPVLSQQTTRTMIRPCRRSGSDRAARRRRPRASASCTRAARRPSL